MGQLNDLHQRLRAAGDNTLGQRQQRLQLAARALDSVSPLATLERGYSIISDADSGQILTSTVNLRKGAAITAQLADGKLEATVTRSARDKKNES